MTDRGIKSRHNLIEGFRRGNAESLDLDFSLSSRISLLGLE